MIELLKVGENGITANLEESVESLPSFYKKKNSARRFHPFDSNHCFQDSRDPFCHSSFSVANANSPAYSSGSGNPDLFYQDSASSKGLN